MSVLGTTNMLLVKLDKSKLELHFEEVSEAFGRALRDEPLELDLLPERGRLAPAFEGLCNLVDFEGLSQSVVAAFCQREVLILFTVIIRVRPQEVVVFVK